MQGDSREKRVLIFKSESFSKANRRAEIFLYTFIFLLAFRFANKESPCIFRIVFFAPGVWATLRSHVVAFQWLPAFARHRYVRHAASPRGTDEVSRARLCWNWCSPAGERDSRGRRGSAGRGSPAQSRWKPCTDSCEDASYNYRRASKPRVEFRFAFTWCRSLRTFITKICIVLFIDRI